MTKNFITKILAFAAIISSFVIPPKSFAEPCQWVIPGAQYDAVTPDHVWRRCTATIGLTDKDNHHFFLTSSQCFRSPNWRGRYLTNPIDRNAWPFTAPSEHGSNIGYEQLWIRSNIAATSKNALESYIDASVALLPSASLVQLHQVPPQIAGIATVAHDIVGTGACLYSQGHARSCGKIIESNVTAKIPGTPPPGDIIPAVIKTNICADPFDAGAPIVTDAGILLGSNVTIVHDKTGCVSYIEPIWTELATFQSIIPSIRVVF